MSAMTIVLLIGGYITFQLIADVTAVKIIDIAGVTVPAAVFIYAITFTWRDMVHKTLGKTWARAAILVAGLCNLFMAAYFVFASALPPAVFWPGDEAFNTTLGIVWRVTLASILAEIVSELIDTEVYHLLAKRFTGKGQFVRVLGSNAVSLPIDSIIFVGVAFAGTMPVDALIGIAMGQIIVKSIITILSLPAIYAVPERQASGRDVAC